MNERIKLLAEQSRKHYPGTELSGEYWVFDEGKFAELIVRECIDWCNANARDDGTAQRIAEDIKKDFGVEE
jgi:hypothetical protein